jgi:hypothetical protein
MPYYSSSAGLTIALASAPTTTYQLTDHNRQPIKLDYEIIEKANRMADGTLRKYVVARKKKFSTSWQMLPSGTGVPVTDYDVIQLTPNAVADVWTNSTGNTNTATPGQSYTATANIRRTLATAGNSYIRIDWKKADGSYNGNTGATNILSINNSSWTQLSVTATAPSDTAYAIIVVNATPASTADYIYVKSVTFAGNSVATSRFVAGTNTAISLTYLSTFKNQNMTHTVDGYKGGAWMKDFYENNLFVPMVLTISHSRDTASANAASAFYPSPANSNAETINCFISGFSYEVVKRYTVTDFVNVSMEFTEI